MAGVKMRSFGKVAPMLAVVFILCMSCGEIVEGSEAASEGKEKTEEARETGANQPVLEALLAGQGLGSVSGFPVGDGAGEGLSESCQVLRRDCDTPGEACREVWESCNGCTGAKYRCPDGRCLHLHKSCHDTEGEDSDDDSKDFEEDGDIFKALGDDEDTKEDVFETYNFKGDNEDTNNYEEYGEEDVYIKPYQSEEDEDAEDYKDWDDLLGIYHSKVDNGAVKDPEDGENVGPFNFKEHDVGTFHFEGDGDDTKNSKDYNGDDRDNGTVIPLPPCSISGHRRCTENGPCLPKSIRCCRLREYPCLGGWDGVCRRLSGLCGHACEPGQRVCGNGECVNPGELCVAPCRDWDEVECPDTLRTCASSLDKCKCNRECPERICSTERSLECRDDPCPHEWQFRCPESGACVMRLTECAPCRAGQRYCEGTGMCVDPARAQFCPVCPTEKKPCRSGWCVGIGEMCVGLCWPNEHRCEDGRCVEDSRQCSSDWDGEDDAEADDSTRKPWLHWDLTQSLQSLQGVYLYAPLFVIIVVAVLSVCVYRWYVKRKEARMAKKPNRSFMECKSGPSLFPCPVNAKHSVPPVKALVGAPPPVWSSNLDIELQSLRLSSQSPQSTQPRSCPEEITCAEEVTENSQLLTKLT